MNQKISIITVCFNAKKTIEETIKSVISQTYPNIEYIIVDGKSTDGTLKIINKYKKKISKIISEKDKGLYDAMNKGTRVAKGEVIYFLNADDILFDKKVVEQVAKEFEKNNELGLVFGDVNFFYPKENKKIRISRNFSLNDLKNGNMPPHQGSFVRKKYLLNYPFNIKYKSSADFDFYCNLIKEKIESKKINCVIAEMQIGGISSGSISYIETENIIKKHFSNFFYYKIKLKHLIFLLVKIITRFFGLKIHYG